MTAMSRGQAPVAKLRVPKRIKSGTASSKKHTFESFSQRIAKLKIEPVRRGRNTIIDDAELDTTFSYFKDALSEWRDINLSEIFTIFARRVAPLCDSLPQVLHHADRILALLVEHIEKGDKNSEEPLLSLMAHFAHDLGVRFEKHFEQAVRTVSQLAATHPDVEVIEWSFTCLAWLFKYLSRLLVPDLRPVFDLMAPLLGKTHQKPFVTRFAAESLSFLVRKAGASYHRDQVPLRLIIKHISDHLNGSQGIRRDIEFQQGIMTLFADSMKGVQRGFHSSSTSIMQEMLQHTCSVEYNQFSEPPLESILIGVLTALNHHSDAEHYQPLLEVILTAVRSKATDTDSVGLLSRLLFVACGVRKGSRVADWRPVLEVISRLVCNVQELAHIEISHIQDLLLVTTVIFQYCPIDAAIPYTMLFEELRKGHFETYFLSFCNTFAELNSERFNTLLLSYFKRFITEKAQRYGDQLNIILPSFSQKRILPSASVLDPGSWQAIIISQFEKLVRSESEGDHSTQILHNCNAFLDAVDILILSMDTRQTIAQQLLRLLKKYLDADTQQPAKPIETFAMGNGLRYLVTTTEVREAILDLWSSLCLSSSRYGGCLSFWRALLAFAENNKVQLRMSGVDMSSLRKGLVLCLGSPSHETRLVALGLLEVIVSDSDEKSNAIATAMLIEQTPISLETQRSISMRIGQLARLYQTFSSDDWIGEAIPMFLFGLLHVKLASVWDDVCKALKSICEIKEGESHVSRIAFEWLSQTHSQSNSTTTTSETPTPPRYVSEFECTNIIQLEHMMAKTQAMMNDSEERLRLRFDSDHVNVNPTNAFSRTQALRVLNELPSIAEKRSRVLTPVLLDWATTQRTTDTSDDDNTVIETTDNEFRWIRKDQKSILTLFSKFTNPRVLYRSSDVYQALLALLTNGDVEIQRAALKALLAWKEPALIMYQENLFNLLDDSRFRDEIAVFLDVSPDQSPVQEQHRALLLPVLLRLLYGKVISGKRGLDAKRKAVFQTLTRFDENAIQQFLGIALGSMNGIHVFRDEALDENILRMELLAPRKQVGMLNMLEDLLNALKTTIRPFVSSIIDPVVHCLITASRSLSLATSMQQADHNDRQDPSISLFKTIRQRSLHALNILFESCPDFAWASYASLLVKELISPRIRQFPIETAQSVSGLLHLFSAWSKSLFTATFLVDFDPEILNKITECLNVPSAKDEVKRFVLDGILRELTSLVKLPKDSSTDFKIQANKVQSLLLQPYANTILHQIGDMLQKSPSKETLESGVHAVAELAPHIVGSTESRRMIEISSFLIKQPSQRVNATTKLGLLKILHEFVPRCQTKDIKESFELIFSAVCPLFSYMKDREARVLLCNIIEDLSTDCDDLIPTARVCYDLNSYSASRLDEPDFDRRSTAFTTVNESSSHTLLQWKPLVYNMLYFIKDNDELSIRMNASLSLRHFIKSMDQNMDTKSFISSAVLPGIQYGMRETSELVRVEFLAVLAQLVDTYQEWDAVADLHVLLSAEEEASFYSNILHIQNHRRLRALRRLAQNSSHLQSGNIYHILFPLLEHFVFNKAGDDNSSSLLGETVKTICSLSVWLEWPQFRSLLKRYITYLSSKEDIQKTIIKLLGGLLDGLSQAGHTKGYASSRVASSRMGDMPTTGVDGDDGDAMEVEVQPLMLSKTMPQQEKLTSDVVNNILPELLEFLRKKDESTVSLRVLVAIAVCKALLILPPNEVELRLPSVLLDISYILRSRAQDSRDMARNTLAEIATFTGPAYLGFILKALRTALSRGYQLHVLSFTMHNILVKLSDQLKPHDLDYCLPDIVDVIMDDIFGVTGQEKDAEEYISKMKEVKSSKSFDSMDIVARSVTPTHLKDLVLPIKSLLLEKLNSKMVQKTDELLRRIGLGVLQNPTVNNRDILVFCYQLVQDGYKSINGSEKTEQINPRNKLFLVNIKGAAKSGARHSTTLYIYKLIRFSLDILRTVLRKHEELQTSQNLVGFLPVIGDALVAGQEEVQISAIRLLSTIMKVSMDELDENCPVYVTEAVRAIKGAPSSNTEIAQASLKLITAILRDRPSVIVKEQDLAHLLKRILPDLDEPDRQGVTFGFVKAIMNRKIVVPEVYEVMDKVAAMMITNQTRSARDIARNSYFNFLMEYPQAKNRFKKQLEFLLKNLRYDYVEGRQSIMEALNLVFTKVGDNVLQEHIGMMFVPLVHSMANDDSADCRTMAGALIKKLFERAESRHLKSFTSDLREWLTQNEDASLKRLGIQCWGLYFEAVETKPKQLEFLLDQLQITLETCIERRDDEDWELTYYSLTVFSKLCKLWPDSTLTSNRRAMWDAIRSCVAYPHAWVKLTSAKLIGAFFADLSSANVESGLAPIPLESSRGLQLSEEAMIKLTNAFLKILTTPNVSEELCIQSVRNLAFLARCLAANGAMWNWQKVDDDDDAGCEAEGDHQPNNMEGNGDAADEEWGGFSPPPEAPKNKTTPSTPTAIHRLITRLSGLIRRETKIMKLSSLYSKSAVMTLLETLMNKLPILTLESSLLHLLTTLSTLTDPSTTIPRSTDSVFNDTYHTIIDKAQEVMNTLQKRMGTQEYLKVMGDVQKGVKQRREERRQKRKIEAVAMPEKFAKEKRRRNAVKKTRRKEKNAEYRGKRRGW